MKLRSCSPRILQVGQSALRERANPKQLNAAGPYARVAVELDFVQPFGEVGKRARAYETEEEVGGRRRGQAFSRKRPGFTNRSDWRLFSGRARGEPTHFLFLPCALAHSGNPHPNLKRPFMKRSLALALATFLGLGLLSTSLPVARNAFDSVTSWSGSYGTR
jgi:hypothetical protein